MKKIFLTVVFFIFSLNSFAELSPTDLNFDSQALNTTSTEQQITLTNILRNELNITDITVNGDFAQTNDCGNSVAPRESCTINITFTPTTAGTHNETLTVISDSSDSPEQVILTGVGEEVIPENQKPTAAFTITPESGEVPLTVALDASSSTDPDGNETIQNYQWVSSDNQSISEAKTASVTFDTQGSYTITLTITDDKGETDTQTKTVIVSEQTVEKFSLEINATNGTVKCSINRGENSDCQSEYDAETSLTLTAVPDTNFEFTGWNGDCPESGDCQITMDANKSITANFSEIEQTGEQTVEKFSLEINATNGTVKCSINRGENSDCQSEYDAETSLTLTAVPDTNFEFTGWNGDCPESGDCQITMDANKSITANFSEIEQTGEQTVEKFSLEINATHGTVKCSINRGENSDCQSEYDAETSLTLTAVPDTNFEFTGWNGDCPESGDCQITMDANKSITANFSEIEQTGEQTVEKFSLEINATNGTVKCSINRGENSDCQSEYDAETSLTLTAVPDTNFEFTGWNGDCPESGDCQITMDANKSITANFSEIEQTGEQTVEKFSLEINATHGTVKCSINRGENSDCQSEYDAETSLTLTAVPDTNFEFTGWNGDCPESGDCQITMDANKSITANFSEIEQTGEQTVEKFSLEINATHGTVKCSINRGENSDCQSEYDAETSLTLTAVPDTDFEFTGWSGDCPESGDCQITMNADKSITANFSEVEQTAEQTVEKFILEITKTNGTVKCSINRGENSDCQSEYDAETSLTLTAEPDTDFEFTGWSGDCSGNATNCQLIMDANKTVNAAFEATDKQKPIATFTAIMNSENLLKIDLDASSSSDDGTITNYEWTATDVQSIPNGETTSVIFDKAGSYEITLTVTDDNGKTDTNTQTVITGYPLIEQVFSIDKNGEARTTTAQFYGGISINNGSFVSELTNENNNVVKMGEDTITVEGIIIPENGHIGQTEILVVGLYTPNTEIVEERCNPANGDYYMLTDGSKTNHYCEWDVVEPNEWCNDRNPTPRRRENAEYVIRWDGKLDSLQALFTDVELIGGQPINLTAEKGNVLYRDIPAYMGHVCLNFGYRLDGTIVFNGTPIEFEIIE